MERGQGKCSVYMHKGARWQASAAQRSHAACGVRSRSATRAAAPEQPLFNIFKILIPPRKYKLKSHFPPIISPKPIDYLFHRLHRCVGLHEYINIAYMKLSWLGLVWEIQGYKVGYTKTQITNSVIQTQPNFELPKTAMDSNLTARFDFLTS